MDKVKTIAAWIMFWAFWVWLAVSAGLLMVNVVEKFLPREWATIAVVALAIGGVYWAPKYLASRFGKKEEKEE